MKGAFHLVNKMSAGTKRSANADEDNNDETNNTAGSASAGGPMVDGGPGLAYMPFVVMEDLLDKLKLLNYEEVSAAYLDHKWIENIPLPYHDHSTVALQLFFSTFLFTRI